MMQTEQCSTTVQNPTAQNLSKQNDNSNGLYQWTAERLLAATAINHGRWVDNNVQKNPIDSLNATRIITDTRKLQVGDIFLAIVGDNFDGHEFLETAQKKGAIAAIVSQSNPDIDLAQLIVDDTRLAFGHIAGYRRRQHKALKVIALTGSSGKTTVKEMLGSIFAQLDKVDGTHFSDKCRSDESCSDKSHSKALSTTLITRGNLNNDYGVPMMLLELTDYHRYAVLELGANHVGEIGYTADLVEPDVACILNIGTAHLGEFGGRENIAKTKAEIYQALMPQGIAIVPNDDDYTDTLKKTASDYTSHILTFGWHNGDAKNSTTNKTKQAPLSNQSRAIQPDITATDIVSSATSSQFTLKISPIDNSDVIRLLIELPLPGAHNISNALAAAGCAYAIGIEPDLIAQGLSQAQSSKGRLHSQPLGIHQIIDDTYNANPNSVRAAVDVLASQEGFKILVLGDIGELGDAASEEHYQLGQAIAAKNIDTLLCVGEFAVDTVSGAKRAALLQAFAYHSKDELLAKLVDILETKTSQDITCTLLFKGSRSATMETLIEALV